MPKTFILMVDEDEAGVDEAGAVLMAAQTMQLNLPEKLCEQSSNT